MIAIPFGEKSLIPVASADFIKEAGEPSSPKNSLISGVLIAAFLVGSCIVGSLSVLGRYNGSFC
jgi:uncharacterized protein involved in exopolysaccharide biosynthesis